MTRSRRLEPVVKVSESREDDAARVMAHAEALVREQESRLNELRRYLAEYLAQAAKARNGTVTAGRLGEYQGFLTRIGEVIAQQEERVRQARATRDARRADWMAARTRRCSLDKVVERYEHEERRAEDRSEQREQDERARGRTGGSGRGDD
jgi:flagellar FliJ protein